MRIPKWLCRILTWGRHWNRYYPEQKFYVQCRLCGTISSSEWEAFNKMQKQKKDPQTWVNERRKKC